MTKQDSYFHTLFTAVQIMKDILWYKFINLSE
jgi:hypothetical protein